MTICEVIMHFFNQINLLRSSNGKKDLRQQFFEILTVKKKVIKQFFFKFSEMTKKEMRTKNDAMIYSRETLEK